MSKIIAPPAIKNLDAFIDLLTDPSKYLAYMQELKAMKDEIIAMLDTLQTKEQADAFLMQASAKAQDLFQREKAMTEREQASQIRCEQKERDAEAVVRSATETREKTAFWVREQEQQIVMRTDSVTALEAAAHARESSIVLREQAVAHAERQLDAEVTKLKRTKELLAGLD